MYKFTYIDILFDFIYFFFYQETCVYVKITAPICFENDVRAFRNNL